MKIFLSLINVKNKKRRGFTLVELIIVIAILAVLAAVAIPAYGRVQESAKISAAVSDGKLVVRSLNMYNSLAKTKLTATTWDDGYDAVKGVLALNLNATTGDDMVDMDLSVPIDSATWGYLAGSSPAITLDATAGFILDEATLRSNVQGS